MIMELAHRYPERIDARCSSHRRAASTISPCAARWASSREDGGREPRKMVTVAIPDYMRFGIPSTMGCSGR